MSIILHLIPKKTGYTLYSNNMEINQIISENIESIDKCISLIKDYFKDDLITLRVYNHQNIIEKISYIKT